MTLIFEVEINEENALADPRPLFQGDCAKAAQVRASWCWLKGMGEIKELMKRLGVKRSWQPAAGVSVVQVEPSAK